MARAHACRAAQVAAAKNSQVALLLDTKGPEVRTAMLRGGKDIELQEGQDIIVVAVGDAYDKWEGYMDEATGETKIGLSYGKLCQSMKPGSVILIADGAISIECVEVLNDTEIRGRVINSHTLGQRKNCNLPGQSRGRGAGRPGTAACSGSQCGTTWGRPTSTRGRCRTATRCPLLALPAPWRPALPPHHAHVSPSRLAPCRRARGPACAGPQGH